jgi:hypothetical protein
MIGLMTIVTIGSLRQGKGSFVTYLSMLGKTIDFEMELPNDWSVHEETSPNAGEESSYFYLADPDGNRYFPNEPTILAHL